MKLLSLWEPWATLMAIGAKRVETRSWSTPYRGWLAIHAAKGGISKRELADVMEDPAFQLALSGEQLQFGKIVAVVRLLGCEPTQLLDPEISQQERTFGDYSPGRYGWETSDVFRLPRAIPFRAMQGLVTVPDHVIAEIQCQYRARRSQRLESRK